MLRVTVYSCGIEFRRLVQFVLLEGPSFVDLDQDNSKRQHSIDRIIRVSIGVSKYSPIFHHFRTKRGIGQK